jgi:cardiolipin synthase A/B
MLYLALGVNRIRRRAMSLGVHKTFSRPIPENLANRNTKARNILQMLARVVSRVVAQPLTPGNQNPIARQRRRSVSRHARRDRIRQKIHRARTYIFDNDPSGKICRRARRAVKRGVAVRVLIDAAGTRYSWPPITYTGCGTPASRSPNSCPRPCSRPGAWPPSISATTANPRRGRPIAFTGGMNIRHGNVLADQTQKPRAGFAFPRRRPGRHAIAGGLCQRLGVHHRRNSRRRNWFPELKETGERHRPRHHRRAGRRF